MSKHESPTPTFEIEQKGYNRYIWRIRIGETVIYEDKTRRGRENLKLQIQAVRMAIHTILEPTPSGRCRWKLPSYFGDSISPPTAKSKAYTSPQEALEAFSIVVHAILLVPPEVIENI